MIVVSDCGTSMPLTNNGGLRVGRSEIVSIPEWGEGMGVAVAFARRTAAIVLVAAVIAAAAGCTGRGGVGDGSEGGLNAVSEQGAALAAQGYPALVVAYFGGSGLPSALQEVPLEYFVKALSLLAKQPGVDPTHLLVWGTSRGSEAALLLGADFPDLVHGVIAGVPSSVAWGSYPESGSAAWTLGGKPVAYAAFPADWNQPDPADAQDAVIPVERIDGPIFLVCGEADRIWASCPYTDAITARLARYHFGYPVIALHYPAAGHYGGDLIPYLPFADAASPTTDLASSGGTELADQQAEANSWPRLLAFLAQQ